MRQEGKKCSKRFECCKQNLSVDSDFLRKQNVNKIRKICLQLCLGPEAHELSGQGTVSGPFTQKDSRRAQKQKLVSIYLRSYLRVRIPCALAQRFQTCRHQLHDNHLELMLKLQILGPQCVGPGTNIFNDSPDNPEARLGLGGNAPSGKDREDTADLRFIPKGDFQINQTREQKLAHYFIQEKRVIKFLKRNCKEKLQPKRVNSMTMRRPQFQQGFAEREGFYINHVPSLSPGFHSYKNRAFIGCLSSKVTVNNNYVTCDC